MASAAAASGGVEAAVASGTSVLGAYGFVAVRVVIAALVATLVARRGVRKKSLSPSGARAAFVVGFLSFAVAYRFGLTLIAFYISSSRLTKHGAEEKKKLEANFEKESQRGAVQVLSCSVVGCAIAAAYAFLSGPDAVLSFRADPAGAWLLAAFLGHYACCAGDTWASELGILDRSGRLPRLALAPWRAVPKGTNGGMSVVGTAASLGGGVFMGAVFAGCGRLFVGPGALQTVCMFHLSALAERPADWAAPLLVLGGFGGCFGSLLDSALGQLLQASYLDDATGHVVVEPGPGRRHICGVAVLSNTQVNLVSALLTSVATGLLAQAIMD